MDYLSLSINGIEINNPGGIPVGGIFETLSIIKVFTTLLIIAAIILSLVYLTLGGISWITSEGDKQKLAQAKSRITYAVIGLLVVILSYFIISIVYNFFGVRNTGNGGGKKEGIHNNIVSNLASNWVLTKYLKQPNI